MGEWEGGPLWSEEKKKEPVPFWGGRETNPGPIRQTAVGGETLCGGGCKDVHWEMVKWDGDNYRKVT